jgi:hypothetical protein
VAPRACQPDSASGIKQLPLRRTGRGPEKDLGSAGLLQFNEGEKEEKKTVLVANLKSASTGPKDGERLNPNFDGTCYGLYRLPDFVVYDKDGKEWIRIKRVGRLPHARFAMFEHGEPICIIQQRSPLRNRYILKFANGPIWKIRLPLFTVFFSGDSDAGSNIRIRLWSHNCWLMQITPATVSPHLVAAIAFLHRERLRCN